MRKVVDHLLWMALFPHTPLAPDSYDRQEALQSKDPHPDDLLCLPGVAVKGGFNGERFTVYGRLAKFLGDPLPVALPEIQRLAAEVAVLCSTDHKTVCVGTVDQYLRMWCVD